MATEQPHRCEDHPLSRGTADDTWRCETCGVVITGDRNDPPEIFHARAAGARDMRRKVIRELRDVLERDGTDYLETDMREDIRGLIRSLEGNRVV